MIVTSMVVRQHVEDLDAAIPVYEQNTGASAFRFSFAGVRMASVGSFLLFTGPEEVVRRLSAISATLTVDDLDAAVAEAVADGAEVLAPIAATATGHRAVLRQPHGDVYEYLGPSSSSGPPAL